MQIQSDIFVETPSLFEVNNFINNPEVFAENRIDGVDSIYVPEIPGFDYLGLYNEADEMVGMICLHPRQEGVEIHLSIQKGYRHHARWFVEEAIRDESVVYASIPEYKRSVINLAHKLGFSQIGFDGHFIQDNIVHRKVLLWRSFPQH